MSSGKPSFLSQPVVKNIFMYRNGDPYYEARRIVINQKRVSTFETLLREVTGGVQPSFGAVRNIYTPRYGHKVDCMDHIQSGEQYVAAGRERFKKLDYLHISSRKKRMMQTIPLQDQHLSVTVGCQPKLVPQSRIIVSARFLKPIQEPCPIFVVANGDVLNPAIRLLIAHRMLSQFDRILEMVTEKMGLRILGGVRSLYTFEGQQVSDGTQLENGQFYVAVGREKFKKLPYNELLFTKARGARRTNGSKTFSLPPIYRSSKQNGNSKSTVRGSDSGEGEFKASPPAQNDDSKQLSSLVREISQARLLSLRKKRSGLTQGAPDTDDVDDGNSDAKTSQDQVAEEKPPTEVRKATGAGDEKEDEAEEAVPENATEEEQMAENNLTNHEVEREGEDGSPGPLLENGTGEQGMNEEMEKDGGSVDEAGGQVERDSGEVEKDGERVEEDNGEVEGGSRQVEEDDGEVEGGSRQVEEDGGEVEGGSRQVEEDGGEVEGGSRQVEEEVEGGNRQVEEHNGQVEEDQGSEEPPASTENVGKDTEREGRESQQAVDGKASSDGEP